MLGLKIGNYKITSMIGEGGMGAVYRAVHESLGRSAAVKVLLPEISTSRDMVTRFFNEARSAASIQHPGIIETYDFGFLPDGRAYIIMEFLEGESLASRLRRTHRMQHVRALQIVRSVARALHAAHEQGIVHRDIKPDNIFLVPDPEMPTGERIKILDFGIAKLGSDGAETGLTQTGAVMGTPTYMAPEQCRGAGSVDRRADLYALGCILYEMLCVRPPFIAEGAGDIIAHHLYFQPQSPRSHDASIAPPLEALVLSLLQKDPVHRPPTAVALVEAIDRLGVPAGGAPMQFGDPVPAPPGVPMTTLSSASTSMGPSVGGPAKRRILIVAGAIVALALIPIVVLVGGGQRHSGGGPAAAPQIDTVAASPDVAVVVAADAAPAAPPPSLAEAGVAAAPIDAALSPAPVPPEPKESVAAKPKRERTPAKQPARSEKTSSPQPSTPSPGVSPTCTTSSFASVIQDKQPDEATVQAALARLRKCQKELAASVFADLQQQLISKL
jgi:eukaryotic-like serine/threonine-protein kinase